MIIVNEELKEVFISESEGDVVVVDGTTFALTNGSIELRNLPSVYDVEVFKKVEENHIERPIPEPVEEPIFEEIIEEPIIEEEPLP